MSNRVVKPERFDLVSAVAIRRRARLMGLNVAKHDDSQGTGYEKGEPLSVFVNKALRHLNDYLTIKTWERQGLPPDTLPDGIDSTEDHLAAAGCNLDMAMHMETVRPDLDDLGKPVKEPVMDPVDTTPVEDTPGMALLRRLLTIGK